jgi:hypothetical protein
MDDQIVAPSPPRVEVEAPWRHNPFVQTALDVIASFESLDVEEIDSTEAAMLDEMLAEREPMLSALDRECVMRTATEMARKPRYTTVAEAEAEAPHRAEALRLATQQREAFRTFWEKAEATRVAAETREWVRDHRAKRQRTA